MNYAIEIQINLGESELLQAPESENVLLDVGQNLHKAMEVFQLLRPNKHNKNISYIRLTLESDRKTVLAFMSAAEEW